MIRFSARSAGCLAVVGGACVTGVYLLAATDFSQPRVFLQSSAIDLGDVTVGEDVRHDFAIENIGSGPLRLGLPDPGCGCTSATVHQHIIAPRGSGLITVDVQTSGLFSSAMRGQSGTTARETVEVATNDRAHPSIVLALTMHLISEFGLSSTSLTFPATPLGGRTTRGVTVEQLATAHVVSADLTDPEWEVRQEPVAQSQARQSRFIVTFAPQRPGRHTANLLIRTSSACMPLLRVFLSSE